MPLFLETCFSPRKLHVAHTVEPELQPPPGDGLRMEIERPESALTQGGLLMPLYPVHHPVDIKEIVKEYDT